MSSSKPDYLSAFSFQAIPSAHDTLERDENGDYKCIGLIVQVAGRTIYHSGDAVPYEGLVERLSRWKIDAAILPINGRDPRRGVPGNFTAAEAVQLGKSISAGLRGTPHIFTSFMTVA